MKTYTDIEQSKMLEEILPVESADMSYRPYREEGGIPDYHANLCPYNFASWIGVPCWSLAALLEYLREIDFFPDIIDSVDCVLMDISFYDDEDGNILRPIHFLRAEGKTILDACVEMIVKLHEQKVL